MATLVETEQATQKYEELLAEVRGLRDIITKMEQWCLMLDVDLTEMQDKLRKARG
ncbi:MAG: hypothetical protein ACO3ND_10905 [Opitutales bacterium]|jgi:hypothetical protein